MRQRAHLGEELRRVLHGVGDVGAAGFKSSGPEFLEFELTVVLVAVVFAVVVGVVVAAVIVFGGSGRGPAAPQMALDHIWNIIGNAARESNWARQTSQPRRRRLWNFRRWNIDCDSPSTTIDDHAIRLDAHQPARIRDVLPDLIERLVAGLIFQYCVWLRFA